ncbi:NAD(P)-dependent oxidoreductase [Planobispora rosea]|uniref:NAD(P)-dependent oxidoreductase n=2 Tax=Planobispora rosea TaxID=35762 RepID=A0A8J3WEM5_PLARO|nr:NAD(P)-dependent oxidoreductase [Planobispora rosea]GIH85111.1 NAD(P)-dependent oxidoreductase [Planobispora rosea]
MLLVTGVSGALGKLIAAGLAGRADAVLASRDPQYGERRIDFDDPASLDFTGVATLLLISAGYGEDDVVITRHGAVIDAAERDGVAHIVYTSLASAGDHLPYALPHRWTERRLRSGRAAWTVLRNGLYAELLAWLAAPDAEGRITAPLGGGKLAAVARRDLAEAACRVALDPAPHAGRVYDLVGEEAVGGAELAEALGAVYTPGTMAQARERVAASGAAPFQVPMLVGTYSAIAHGFMDGTAGDLRALLGRAPTGALDVIGGKAA